ncbi:MAG: hypothetical protein QXE01_07575 [Sulfolobales archaeon]
MVRGFSSLVISLIMLAIVVPIGVILVERSREALNVQPPIEVPALLRIYGFANGSKWFLAIVNFGSSDVYIRYIVLSNGSIEALGISVPPHSMATYVLASESRPLYVVVDRARGVFPVETIG